MAELRPNETAATLVRRRSYTIDVPGLGPVTYSRGETVPQKHFQHVPPEHRRWFDAVEDEENEEDE